MAEADFLHRPVLYNEVMIGLRPELGGLFIDCTLGLGGHSAAILKANDQVNLIGIDRDQEALSRATSRLAEFGPRFQGYQSDFRQLPEVMASVEAEGRFAGQPVRGILVDLGVSSMQLDNAERGFSFQATGPLDMRMDQSQLETAATLVNNLSEKELADLIYQYGEETAARLVARKIVAARGLKPIETTTELAQVVLQAIGWKRSSGKERIHPATRTFQALRIAVNQELSGLPEFVHEAVGLLSPGGRLAVMSFHSLEDRLIKQAFRLEAGECSCPPRFPVCTCGAVERVQILTKKPLIATDEEVIENARARSAKLRICEKLVRAE